MQTLARPCRAVCAVVCCAIVLVGCGQKKNEAAATNGQIAARIGGEVITRQEIENELHWANFPQTKQQDPESIRKVLGELVQRKFLVRQAMTAKLDREPGVLLDLLRSRDVVLANSYLTRAAAAHPPGKADVENYISDSPQKFDKRELYTVEQVVFPLGPESQPLVDGSKNVRSLEEADSRLSSAGIQHVRQTASLLSSDMPPDLVRLIAARRPDQVFFLRAGPNGAYFHVVSTETRPLTGEAAAEFARQALRADALKAEAGVAAYSANLEVKYDGDYARIMGKRGAEAGTANN